MCVVTKLVCGSVHQDGLGFAAVTNDLQISVTYSNTGAFLVHTACPLQIGRGFSPHCLGSGSQADRVTSVCSTASLRAEHMAPALTGKDFARNDTRSSHLHFIG